MKFKTSGQIPEAIELRRAPSALDTHWDTWPVYPGQDTKSPRKEPLMLRPISSPSTISGADALVASEITENLSTYVLIFPSFLKVPWKEQKFIFSRHGSPVQTSAWGAR